MAKLDAPRLTVIIPRYWPATGGSELHAHLLVNGLCEQGWRVNVVTQVLTNSENCELTATQTASQTFWDGDAKVSVTAPAGWRKALLGVLARFHQTSAPARLSYDHLLRQCAVRNIIEQARNSQLIHFIYNGMTSLAEAALEAARTLGIPFVLTPLANTELPPGTGWASRRMARLLKAADSIVALTDFERTWLISQGAPADKTTVCPMGPVLTAPSSVDSFRERYGLADHPVVLFLARHDEAKGYRLLAEARRGIWARHPNARILFVGPQTVSSRAYFETIRDHRIQLLENLSQPDKNAALNACSLLCVPSSRESLGSVYLEAWHYKKPVIALSIPILRTFMSHGVDCLLCKPDQTDIATAINSLLGAPARREAMGLAGQLKQQTRFRWPVIVSAHASIYRSLSHRKSHCPMSETLLQTSHAHSVSEAQS